MEMLGVRVLEIGTGGLTERKWVPWDHSEGVGPSLGHECTRFNRARRGCLPPTLLSSGHWTSGMPAGQRQRY